MPEPLQSDANIVTKRETVEVITPDGKSLPQAGAKNLESIFDKIEGGQNADQAIKETMSSKPVSTPDKKEEPAPEKEPKEEPADSKTKETPAGLDAALTKAEERANPTPKPDDGEVSDDELKVLPQDKPKTAKRIQALLTKINKE